LQGAYLIMAARSLGLDCGPMSGFDNEKLDAAFFPDGRVGSGTKTFCQCCPQLDLGWYGTALQCLCISIANDKIHARYPFGKHMINCVTSTTTNTNNFNYIGLIFW
jgi:hypothetical protein